ncbi:hypothetical protein [Mycoplana rhizolycopersici]|uniref:Transcriptional regulator n=1 Tax=Mycoplana rhizolycopersici TaxID=2746702 RepID=A0ABX2QE10_9HYPH|nr:hypothetical protein [Rhizobium rhizolycopersici]NVP54644.1 hypothetical protein [Rhizobium rhizolycopersici]
MAATKEEFFKRTKTSAEEKAAQTNAVARDIIAAEAVKRALKTERLRQLRESQAGDAPDASAAQKPKPRTSKKK